MTKPILIAVLAAAGALAEDDRFTRELDDAARVASIIVDGDVCRNIVTASAMDYMGTPIRISRLVSFPADANLWMPIPGRRVTVAQKPGWVSVLAPVSDSLGDIVAVVEVASQRQLDPHENVK